MRHEGRSRVRVRQRYDVRPDSAGGAAWVLIENGKLQLLANWYLGEVILAESPLRN